MWRNNKYTPPMIEIAESHVNYRYFVNMLIDEKNKGGYVAIKNVSATCTKPKKPSIWARFFRRGK